MKKAFSPTCCLIFFTNIFSLSLLTFPVSSCFHAASRAKKKDEMKMCSPEGFFSVYITSFLSMPSVGAFVRWGNGDRNVPHLHCVNSEVALKCRERLCMSWGWRRRRWKSDKNFEWFSSQISFYIFSEQRTSKLLRHKLSCRSSVGGKRHFRQSLFHSQFFSSSIHTLLCGGNVKFFFCVKYKGTFSSHPQKKSCVFSFVCRPNNESQGSK